MKIRNGFVSNSSSSSFIIAVKNDISEDEKMKIFKKYIEKPYEIPCNFDLEGLTKERVIRSIFGGNLGGNLELEGWSICWGECGTEDGDFLSWLLYCLPDIDTPWFKFKTYC
jgi:hypothetical protein